MSIVGVTLNRRTGRWSARLHGYTPTGRIGEFGTEEQATAARQAAELAFHGYVHEQVDIEISGDVARVPLRGRNGVVVGWATIDAEDVELIRGRRWHLSAKGYVATSVGGAEIYMHRLIVTSRDGGGHINGVKLDNRQANLRVSRRKAPLTRAQALSVTLLDRAQGECLTDSHAVHLAHIAEANKGRGFPFFQFKETA